MAGTMDANLPIVSRVEARERGLSRYYTGEPCRHGHVSERSVGSANCITCQRQYAKSAKGLATIQRLRSRPEYREKAKVYSARYHAENRDECLSKMADRNRAYYARNRERLIEAAVSYQRENADTRNAYKSDWQKRRKKADPQFAAMVVMRKLVARTCERIKQDRKQIGRTVEALGYTAAAFKSHIENQFHPGMSWANHGEWHVDHIRPLSSFDLTNEAQRKECNSLANLQPMWAGDNMRKGSKLVANLASSCK